MTNHSTQKKSHSSIYAKILYFALKERGVDALLEYNDGYKRVDIAIPDAFLYIEIDGIHHLTSAEQLRTDFFRDYYSQSDGFYTLHISTHAIKTQIKAIADAIAEVIQKGSLKLSKAFEQLSY